jgi:hypothetical protein
MHGSWSFFRRHLPNSMKSWVTSLRGCIAKTIDC